MAEPLDIRTGHVICEGRPNQDGSFDIMLYPAPDHGHRPGSEVEAGKQLGDPAVILRLHDVRACDSFSLAIRGAREALSERRLVP